MQNLNIRDRIVDFISTIPTPVSVKAYGSSVAYQSGYASNEKKQVDLIVIVDDIKKFYKVNLKENDYMYKLTPKIYFRLASIKGLKKHASICYTTHINYGDDTYKMGVIEKSDVIDDLLNWKSFYIAGRFQKEMFTAISDPEIEKANEINKRNALTVSLLLLDRENPTLDNLYETLCSLSYMGDNRKVFNAEDPNKVKKLASGSKDFFDREYRDKTDLFTVNSDNTINVNYSKVIAAIKELPSDLQNKISLVIMPGMSEDEVFSAIRSVITSHLTEIVKSSSHGQTRKGILTTGPVNSVSYAWEKLKKGRKKDTDCKRLVKDKKNV